MTITIYDLIEVEGDRCGFAHRDGTRAGSL
jgi:hypothetical protein